MALRELDSIPIPTWEARAHEQLADRTSDYIWGVDAGPDNQGFVRMVYTRLLGLQLVTCTVVFCQRGGSAGQLVFSWQFT